MKVYDLSHTIEPGMPVFPGTEPPLFLQGNTITTDGFAEKKITFFSHTGTHIDAPAHILADQPDLGQLPIDSFFGQALRIDISTIKGDTINTSQLEPYLKQLKQVDFVLFAAGWYTYWGSDTYFLGYPVLTPDAAKLLCQYKLKGIGFDSISADRADSHTLPIHRILLKKMIIIENLANLETIPTNLFLFSCLPLKIADGDGSPVRAIAICDETLR
jgi:arylformamidase